MSGGMNRIKHWIWNFIKNHTVTFFSIIGAIVVILFFHNSLRIDIWSYIRKQPTAFATLVLALVTVIAILREPASRIFNRPILKLHPDNIMKYPEDKTHDTSIFAVEPASGSQPCHIWIRLYVENLGRSVARNVYVKIVSVRRTWHVEQEGTSIRLAPFNPFKLRWVSLDRITSYQVPWYGSTLTGSATHITLNGDLAPNEAEYVNMCTFVGEYYVDNEKLKLCPLLVPGLPESDGRGNIVGQGSVAGMNKDILRIKRESVNGDQLPNWETAKFEYELIVGGSNFKTKHLHYTVNCSIDSCVKESADKGKYDVFRGLERHVNVDICVKGFSLVNSQ